MTTLKTLTLEKISSTLPPDLITDLVHHNIERLVLPKVTNLNKILYQIYPDYEDEQKDFLQLLLDFSFRFPELLEKVKDVKKFILNVNFEKKRDVEDEWIEEELIKLDHQSIYQGIIHNSKIIFKMDGHYYTFSTKKIQGYKRHNEIIEFFTSRNIEIIRGCKLIYLHDFDSS